MEGYQYFLNQLRLLPEGHVGGGGKESWIMDRFETTTCVKQEIDPASDRAYIECFCTKSFEKNEDPSVIKEFIYAITDGPHRRFYFSSPPNFVLEGISEKEPQCKLEVYNLRDKADEAKLNEMVRDVWTIDDYQGLVRHLIYKKLAKVADPDAFMQACVERHGPILLKRTK